MPSAPPSIWAGPTSDDPNQPTQSDTGGAISHTGGVSLGGAQFNAPTSAPVSTTKATTVKQAGGSPFVSFNDYLNANASALASERGSSLAAGQASLDKLGADVKPMTDAAYGQGADAAKASWSAQRQGVPLGDQKSTDYKAPTDFSVNFSSLPGQEQFATDKAKAESDINAIGQGGLGMGKTAFEAGMIGADQSYQQGAKDLHQKYQDSVNAYLDQIKGAGAAGVASFKPAPIVSYQPSADPASMPSRGPDGMPLGNEGPAQKPRIIRRKYVNGKPVGGEEEP